VNFEESNEKKNARSTRLPNGKISKDQILKDLKGAASKLKKPTKMKRTKEDMKRDSKHR
jgi:ribosomal RNA-processing protein 36